MTPLHAETITAITHSAGVLASGLSLGWHELALSAPFMQTPPGRALQSLGHADRLLELTRELAPRPAGYMLGTGTPQRGVSSTQGALFGHQVVPLQSRSGPDLDALIARLQAAVALPAWVGTMAKWSGLIIFVLGLLAYFGGPTLNMRRRGFVLATSGVLLAIIGFGFPIFISLIHYVLTA